MHLASDFKEMLAALSSEGAEYLVVGAYAVMSHTEPRYTKDLDLWVRPTRANARRVMKALKRFGAALHTLRESDLTRPGVIFQMGVAPVRIDLITEVDGVDFEEAWARRTQLQFGKVSVGVLSVRDLLINKRRVARPQDLLDVAKLEALPSAAEKKQPAPRKPRPRRR